MPRNSRDHVSRKIITRPIDDNEGWSKKMDDINWGDYKPERKYKVIVNGREENTGAKQNADGSLTLEV